MIDRFFEKDFNGWGQTFLGNKIFELTSAFQKISIVETNVFGKVLLLDDIIQCTEKDESSYHEMLTHVPIIAHGSVKSVLIIGGGDGGILKEVLRYQEIESVVLVEIDKEVINVSKKLLPSINDNAFEDLRVSVIIQDAFNWIKTCDQTFDIIIVDRSDGFGPAVSLYLLEFYKNCKAILNEEGIFVAQTGSLPFNIEFLKEQLNHVSCFFKKASFYLTTVNSFIGGQSCFIWASKWNITTVSSDVISKRITDKLKPLKFYNDKVHQAAFALPNYLRDV